MGRDREKKQINKKKEIEKLREKELSVPMKKATSNHLVKNNTSNEISVIHPVKSHKD